MSVCKSCGNQIPDGTKFCVICGAAQPQQSDPAVQNIQQPYVQQNEPAPQPQQSDPAVQNIQQPYVQQNIQQPQHAQQNAASQNIAEEPKKKKKKMPLILKILIILVLAVGAALAAILIIGRVALSNADKASYYEIGSDSIPSLRQVLNDPDTLKMTGLSVSTSTDGTSTKEYQYESEGARDGMELYTYAMYLKNQGYSFLTDGYFADTSGSGVKMGRNASESGYAIIIQFDWQPGKYKILIMHTVGSVTVSDPRPDPLPVNPDPGNADAETLMNADLIRWIKSGEYYFEAVVVGFDGTRGETLFGKQGANAAVEIDLEGNIVRVVQKGNDIYYISPTERTVYITKVSEADSFSGPNFDSFTITGSGTGTFDGQTLLYVSYIPDGVSDESICWFRNGDLYAIQTSDGSAIIIGNAASVPPSSLFEIPTGYDVTDNR